MTTAEPKRNLFQNAIYNFFAVWLGITPPSPGQEIFYGGLLLALVLLSVVGGFFIIRFLMGQMLG